MAGFDTDTVPDSSLAAQTPEGIGYVLYPAGIAVRAGAWGIDCVLKETVVFILIIFLSIYGDITGIWFFMIINFALNWFYHVLFDLYMNGQTPGKRIMGIRVVCGDGSPVTPGASFLRNLLRFADGFFFLYLIGFICMAVSPGFRRIGDWAGDTLVVYTSRFRLSGKFSDDVQNIIPFTGIPARIPAGKFKYDEKQGLLMFASRYPLLGKERADEIAKPWAASLRSSESHSDLSDSEYLLGIARSLNI